MGRTFDVDVNLRWSDADRNGHINNSRFATFAEDARIDWITELFGNRQGGGASLILARQEIDYHRQVITDDERDKRMVMRTSVLKVGRTSVRIRQELWGAGDTSPACTVVCVLVHFDYEKAAAIPWDDETREWMRTFAAEEK